MQIRSKLWIESGGEPVFGRGRMLLLSAIEKLGSINQAAAEVSISYRKAWGYIKAMEQRLGIALVVRQAGGKNGGGAFLTEDARSFIARYRELEAEIHALADRRFNEIFDAEAGRAYNDHV